MILLLGGTTEAAPIARALVQAGYSVLLSTATNLALRGRFPDAVERIVGKMDDTMMSGVIRHRNIRAVVDATHPYAAAASENAYRACGRMEIPYLAYDRPGVVGDSPDIYRVKNHKEGARAAFFLGRPVLLTIGVRNLSHYVAAARGVKGKIVARVLDQAESMAACMAEGLATEEVVCANGPFSMEENLSLILNRKIGVLVTKDSGDAGGVGSKIAAAREAGCRVVVVDRPCRPLQGHRTVPELMAELRVLMK